MQEEAGSLLRMDLFKALPQSVSPFLRTILVLMHHMSLVWADPIAADCVLLDLVLRRSCLALCFSAGVVQTSLPYSQTAGGVAQGNDSAKRPYLDTLPTSHDCTLCWNDTEMSALKGQ